MSADIICFQNSQGFQGSDDCTRHSRFDFKKMPVDLVLLDNFRLNLLKHADLKMYDILQFGAFCGI